jgi:hypothetical protein
MSSDPVNYTQVMTTPDRIRARLFDRFARDPEGALSEASTLSGTSRIVRNELMVEAWIDDMSLTEIARAVGLTQQRTQQIVAASVGKPLTAATREELQQARQAS